MFERSTRPRGAGSPRAALSVATARRSQVVEHAAGDDEIERPARPQLRQRARDAALDERAAAKEFDTEDVPSSTHAGTQIRKLKRKGNPQSAHVTPAEYDNRKLYFATGGTPVVVAITRNCPSSGSPPAELHLEIVPKHN